jgi:hypothetical protein
MHVCQVNITGSNVSVSRIGSHGFDLYDERSRPLVLERNTESLIILDCKNLAKEGAKRWSVCSSYELYEAPNNRSLTESAKAPIFCQPGTTQF